MTSGVCRHHLFFKMCVFGVRVVGEKINSTVSKAQSVQNCYCSLTLLQKKNHLLVSSGSRFLGQNTSLSQMLARKAISASISPQWPLGANLPLALWAHPHPLAKTVSLPSVNFAGVRRPPHIILGSWKISCDFLLNHPSSSKM